MTRNAHIANADERERWRLADFFDEIIDVLQAIGMSDGECNVKYFPTPREGDEVIVIMIL